MNPKRVVVSLAVAFALSLTGGPEAAASGSRDCRRECKALIATCRPRRPPSICRRARRMVLAHCRDEGVAYCQTEWGPTVNRCNRAWAEEHRGEDSVFVRFDPVFGDFSPECVSVSSGTEVTFRIVRKWAGAVDFSVVPLIGGETGVVDPSSPFNPPTTTGSTVTFSMAQPGFFPYHGGTSSEAAIGAVIVGP